MPYQEALARQLLYVEEIAEGKRTDTIVFCSHSPVVTLGRATQPDDVTDWQGELVEVTRGGRATYHGPDQMVVYPILDLKLRGRDLHKHLRWIERVIKNALEQIGAFDRIRSHDTGIWIGEKKICSIGIAVRKWISYHGLSLAVDNSLEAYNGIRPCGLTPNMMTNLETVLGHAVDRELLKQNLQTAFLKIKLSDE